MALIYEPCQDGDDRAAAVKSALQIERSDAERLGRSAVVALEEGVYPGPDGSLVDWSDAVARAVGSRRSVPPDERLPPIRRGHGSCRVRVSNETTLMAARRMMAAGANTLALNMANGVTPGGGFLHGARAQEETLCRSSALYATIVGDPMYELHRRRSDHESTSSAILSPGVPVFRRDDGTSLAEPWGCNVISCAAPVAQRVGQPRSGDLLSERIERILDIAAAFGFDTLVLGAWGCGAFGNDPARAARDFHTAVDMRAGLFDEVVFAITDWSPKRRFLGPFRDEFSR